MSSENTNGPPLVLEYRQGAGFVTRNAFGRIMNRYDVLQADGWHDWSQRDNRTGRDHWVNGDKLALAPVGQPAFNGIAASRDCLECHTVRAVSAEGVSFAGLRAGPVEVGLKVHMATAATATAIRAVDRRPSWVCPKPSPMVKVVQGPPGPQGPIGPRGPQGPPGNDGRDGKDADMELLVRVVNQWLEQHKDELKGEKGDKGDAGGSGTIDYDLLVIEIAKRLPPFRIGAKEWTGETITMQPTPVHLGDDVFIRVKPPKLTQEDINQIADQVQSKINAR